MRAYRCDMCHSVFLLNDGNFETYEDAPGFLRYDPKYLKEDKEEIEHRYDLCHGCAQKIERFISDNLEEVRKKVLE